MFKTVGFIFLFLFLFPFLFVGYPVFGNIQNAPAMDLKSALQQVGGNSGGGASGELQFKSAAFDTAKRKLTLSQLQEKIADSKLWPSLDFAATHSDIGLNIGSLSGINTKNEWAISLTQSLYDNGVSLLNSKVASLQNQQAEQDYREQREKICLDVALEFLNYSLKLKTKEVQEKQFKLSQKQFETMSKDFQQGIKTKREYMQFKALVGRMELDFLQASNAVDKSKLDLYKLLGIPVGTAVDFLPLSLASPPNSDFPIAANSIENQSTSYIPDHFAYRSAQYKNQVSLLNTEISAKKLWPEWFVTAGVNYGDSNYLPFSTSSNPQWSWNLMLTMKYNFLDFGGRKSQYLEAVEKEKIQKNEFTTSMDALKVTLNQLAISQKQALKSWELARELLELENTNLEINTNDYRNGLISYYDYLVVLGNLSNMELRLNGAISDLFTIHYNWLYHQGKLYEELVR